MIRHLCDTDSSSTIFVLLDKFGRTLPILPCARVPVPEAGHACMAFAGRWPSSAQNQGAKEYTGCASLNARFDALSARCARRVPSAALRRRSRRSGAAMERRRLGARATASLQNVAFGFLYALPWDADHSSCHAIRVTRGHP
eukprot:4510908-Pleurochrysis_carterae.AAC.2